MADPDSTAARVALWRAMHVLVDPPPHVLEDELGFHPLSASRNAGLEGIARMRRPRIPSAAGSWRGVGWVPGRRIGLLIEGCALRASVRA